MKWSIAGVAGVIGLVLSAVGWTGSLVEMAEHGDTQAVLSLLETGEVDVNSPSSNGTTALHWAVYHEDETLVERLIAAGADVNAANAYGSTPMREAAMAGNPAILQALLEAGADVESANDEGQTALMVVARSSNVEAARVLIEHGADVNATEEWRGQTALIWAAAQSQPEMVRLLIEAGADVNARTRVNKWERQITAEPRYMWRPAGGFTALIYAAREDCLACARHLVDAGADIDLADGESRTPLLISIINLHFDLARFLIEAGANVNKWDIWGNQPLYAAVDMNTLPEGGHPDRPSMDDTSPLEIIDLLLAGGANPNAQLKLMLHHRSITDDRGADPILGIGATPLLRSAKAFDVPAIERLLANGALVGLENFQGITPIMAAAGLGATIVDTRGDYSAPDVQQRSIAAIDRLLAAGADVNGQSDRGFAPIHGAAYWGWTKVVEHLVDRGADPLLASKEGYTALDVAEGEVVMGFGRGASTADRPETAQVLQQLMARAAR